MTSNVWIAASEGNLPLVESFFDADATLTPTSPDHNTYTPLHAAASYAHHDLLRWLLKHPRGSPKDVDYADEDGDTPLFVVEDVATAKLLIEEFGADAMHKNKEGVTAAATMFENGFDEAAQFVRGVTGEPAPVSDAIDEEGEEEDGDDEDPAANAAPADDEKHDGETTKRYVELLQEYTSCEISDALIKLKHPTGGHIPNIHLTSPPAHTSHTHKICGQAYPILMVSSTDTTAPPKPAKHFVDSAPRHSIIVIQAPSAGENAVWGGLMTARAQFNGVKGVVIDGKCRDLREHWDAGFSLWSRGHSTLGQAPFTRPAALGCSLTFAPAVSGTNTNPPFPSATLQPTDIVLADVDGVVFVPRSLVPQVVDLAAKGRAVDDLCMQDIKAGRSIEETFKDRRGK